MKFFDRKEEIAGLRKIRDNAEKNDPSEIVIYESSDGAVKLPIRVDYGEETVWLNRAQIAELFDRDIKTTGRHINNSLKEELPDQAVVAKFATTAPRGAIEGKVQTHMTEFYNLEAKHKHVRCSREMGKEI